MKKDTPWSSGPLGPYLVTRRYRGIGGGLGRLYEARHHETGNAALLLMPGPGGDLRPEEPWRLRLSSSVTPPYLSLEVEHAPMGGQAPELTWLLDRWATALVRVDERPDTQAHLTGGAQAPRPRPGIRVRWMGGGPTMAALLALAVALWPATTPKPLEPVASPGPSNDGQLPPVQILTKEAGAIALPMPSGPFKGQNRPPCKSRHEVELRGGCWVEIAARPPCGDDSFEHQGKCYMPGYSAPRPPQVIHP